MSIYYFYQEILERPFFHNYRKAQMWSWLETKDAVMNPTDLKTHHKTSAEVLADPEGVLVKVALPENLLEGSPGSLSFY